MAGCASPLQAEQAWVPGSWRGPASQSAPCPGTLQESTISRPGGTPASRPKPTGSLQAGGHRDVPWVPWLLGKQGRDPAPPSFHSVPALLWMTARLSRGMLRASGCAHGVAPGKMQRHTGSGCFCTRHSRAPPRKGLTRGAGPGGTAAGQAGMLPPCGGFPLQPRESRCAWALRSQGFWGCNGLLPASNVLG